MQTTSKDVTKIYMAHRMEGDRGIVQPGWRGVGISQQIHASALDLPCDSGTNYRIRSERGCETRI